MDTASKYAHMLKLSLAWQDPSDALMHPDKKNLYEIAYLWWTWDARHFVFDFLPEEESDLPNWFRDIRDRQTGNTPLVKPVPLNSDGQFSLSSSDIATLLGDAGGSTTESTDIDEGAKDETVFQCGDAGGVVIWEWLSAIQCWLADLFKTEWKIPDIDNNIGFPELPSIDVNVDGNIIWSTKELEHIDLSDQDSNGVTDYVEKNASSLSLVNTFSDTFIEPHQTIHIDTVLESSTHRIDDDRSSVQLVVTRLDDLESGISYSPKTENWDKVLDQYIAISGSRVLTDGHAVWSVRSNNQKKVRVFIESNISNINKTFLHSERSLLLIWPKDLSVTIVSSPWQTQTQSVRAGEKNSIEVILGNSRTPLSRVNVQILDYVTGKSYISLSDIVVTNKKFRLENTVLKSFIQRAGKYKMIVSAWDIVGETHFTITPDVPHHLSASLPSILLRDDSQLLILSLADIYGNAIRIEDLNVSMTTNDPVVISQFGQDARTQFQWKIPKNLTLTPTKHGNLTLDITLSIENTTLKTSLTRPILSDLKVVADISREAVLSVGEKIPVSFSIQRNDGTLVDTWHMPITLWVRGGDASIADTVLSFDKGRASTYLHTGKRAAQIQLYLQDTRLGSLIWEPIMIHPGNPHQLSIQASSTRLSAKVGASIPIFFSLKDRFGNLTDLQWYTWSIEDSQDGIYSIDTPIKNSSGIFETSLISRWIPGYILLHAWLTKEGKKADISTLENVLQINALPVISTEDVSENTWKSITQVLLWGVFGQTTIEDYFAGSVLFSQKTKTLAISTLLDQPSDSAFSIMPTGNISLWTIKYGTGLSVVVDTYDNQALKLVIQDSRLGDIARITYPRFSEGTSYDICAYPEDDIKCDHDTVGFVPADPAFTLRGGSVYQNDRLLFALKDVFSYPNIRFWFISQSGKSLQFTVSVNENLIGILAIRFAARAPVSTTPSPYSLELFDTTLATKLGWDDTSSHDTPSLIAYDQTKKDTYIWWSGDSGWSQYWIQAGLGWTGDNVSLLQFAAWQDWSISQKEFSDYVSINLGDPIIRLPLYDNHAVTGLDQTIGEPVYFWESPIQSMTFRDANNDWIKDLIVFQEDGTVGLRLYQWDNSPLDVGDLLSVPNVQDGMIRAGDFIGDGYVDIIFVDTEWILHLIDHTTKGPVEKTIQYDVPPVLGDIVQLEVFDMDHDTLDDVVLMDGIGSLYILYWSHAGIFTVQFIENVYDYTLWSEPKASFFTGAIRYDGPGYRDPETLPRGNSIEMQSKQDLIRQTLFTPLSLPKTSTSDSVPETSLKDAIYNTLDTDEYGLLRMYDWDGKNLVNTLTNSYDKLQKTQNTSIRVLDKTQTTTPQWSLLKAPFINPNFVLITKKYNSLDSSKSITSGSPVAVTLAIKNTSSNPIKNIVLLEEIPPFLQVSEKTYTLTHSGKTEQISFTRQGDSIIFDLRGKILDPDQSFLISYWSSLASFSFWKFDVGYLEDKNDPNTGFKIPASDIRTLHPKATQLSSINEREFYDQDVFGDIRFNPNNSCWGPLFLWRSHNSFDRTYHKTFIVRNIQDPTKNAIKVWADPTQVFGPAPIKTTENLSSDELQKIHQSSVSDLATWQADSDGDSIPNRDDDDYGDVFEVSNSGNSTQISIGLGKIDAVIDDIEVWVNDMLAGMSCGFGDPGCISMPINWTANVPWNTLTALWFPREQTNYPPYACFSDVRCGYPIFSIPTICSETGQPECMWPTEPQGAWGAFDYHGGATGTQYLDENIVKAQGFIGGDGVSTFRIFVWATLTWAIAEVVCFGPNNRSNPAINIPWLFPVVFEGNCIFATQPLMQCEDDWADESPLLTEMDIASEINQNNDKADLNGNINLFTNADSCDFYEPLLAYPDELSEKVSNYFAQSNAQNLDSLQTSISDNIELITERMPTESGIYLSTNMPEDANPSLLNHRRGITLEKGPADINMIQISLDANALNLKDFWDVLDINLRSIKGFPNFIIDWYHRQLDEIISSLGNLPDIKLYLPNLTSLADPGWMSSLGSWDKNQEEKKESSDYTQEFPIVDNAYSNGSKINDKSTPNDFIQTKTTGIRNAFEYLSNLPIIDIHPETIDFQIPWIGKQQAQAWLIRNQAILEAWKNLPNDAANAVDTGPLITSIETNIETVRSYLELPEKLQNLFYIKEKLLHGVLQNVHAVQEIFWGWLYDNGLRFKAWVEVFILMTKLWDLWQILIDVFDDYEAECGVCRNERWNLQHWLWIIISMIIPPIPVIQMPRWPDIELDFSDIDLSLDIAYPVFNLSFYPVNLPDAPLPTISGFPIEGMPLLPQLPNFDIDVEIPVIQLPDLPDLPPPPKIPELSQSIEIVLKIFKIIVLIQCLYRKIPLSPEWYVGTKVAHKTERQGFLPFDFLDFRLPTASMEWLDAIRVSTHVQLHYDASYIIDMLRSVLQPLMDFPRNLHGITNIESVDVTSDLQALPELVASLYSPYISAPVSHQEATKELAEIDLDISPENQNKIARIVAEKYPYDIAGIKWTQDLFKKRFDTIKNALVSDIQENSARIHDLDAWQKDIVKAEDIAFISHKLPGFHLTYSSPETSQFLSLEADILGKTSVLKKTYAWWSLFSALPKTNSTVNSSSWTPRVSSQKLWDNIILQKNQWLYVTQWKTTRRLIDYTEKLNGEELIYSIDDDWDGDSDVYYSIDKKIYRKENYQKAPQEYFIIDAPKIYHLGSIYREFFGISSERISDISGDSQIHILRNDSFNHFDYQFYTRKKDAHHRLMLFKSLFLSQKKDAEYIIDIIPKSDIWSLTQHSILWVPYISSVSWNVMLEHKKIYRTLLTRKRYIDENGKIENLPDDFVIRASQSWYAPEESIVEVIENNKSIPYSLKRWQKIVFAQDSRISIKKGKLILFGTIGTQQGLSIRDTGLSISPWDKIITGDNGSVVINFPDGIQTNISRSQKWLYQEYSPNVWIKNNSFSVADPSWLYSTMEDARSLEEYRIPQYTLINTYTRQYTNDIIAQIPRELPVSIGRPTEIDFQKFFPSDILISVDVTNMLPSEWRKISNTVLAFEIPNGRKDINLRITTAGNNIHDYKTVLIASLPATAISYADNAGNVSGVSDTDISSPLGIQTYLDDKTWPLISTSLSKDKKFQSKVPEDAQIELSYDNSILGSFYRNEGFFIPSEKTTLISSVNIGQPLSYFVSDSKDKRALVQYVGSDIYFSQIADENNISRTGIYLVWAWLRLEPALLGDEIFQWWVYITDVQYRPVLALDSGWVVTFLDKNVQYNVSLKGGKTIFALSRNREDLGNIIIFGNMITQWKNTD
jgi:hypothetical protein